MKAILLYQSMPILFDIFYIYLIYHLGIIQGCLVIYIAFNSFNLLMKKCFNLTKVSSGDLVMMWNTYEKTYNLSLIMKFDKMNVDTMREYLIENLHKKFAKSRMRLVYKYLSWWWEELPLSDAIKTIQIVDTKDIVFKTEEDLTDYVAKELKIHIDLEKEIPYKIFIIKNDANASELRNIVILKVDHAFADGMSCTLISTGIATNYSANLYPTLASKEITILKKLLLIALLPYNIIRIANNYVLRVRNRKTPLKMQGNQTGIANLALSKRMNFNEIRDINKKLGVTFNNFITTINVTAMKKYYKEFHNYEDNIINVYTPIGMVPIPKRREDILISNNTSGFGAKLEFVSDPLRDYPKIVRGYGHYVNDYSLSYCQKIITDWLFYYTPFYCARNLSFFIFRCYDLVNSNVPGSKEKLQYGESTVIDMFPMLTPGFKPSFFVFFSYCENFRVVVSTDHTLNINPKDIVKKIEEEVEYCVNNMKHFTRKEREKEKDK